MAQAHWGRELALGEARVASLILSQEAQSDEAEEELTTAQAWVARWRRLLPRLVEGGHVHACAVEGVPAGWPRTVAEALSMDYEQQPGATSWCRSL